MDNSQPAQNPVKSKGNKKFFIIIAIIVIILLLGAAVMFYFFQKENEKQNAMPCGSNIEIKSTPCTNIHGQPDQSISDKNSDCQVYTKDTEVGRIYSVSKCKLGSSNLVMEDAGTNYLNARGELINNCRVEIFTTNDICNWLEGQKDWQLLNPVTP